MNRKDKAEQLVDEFRIILMNEDTECGNEILCTLIAKKCALKLVQTILDILIGSKEVICYWQEVKEEINKL